DLCRQIVGGVWSCIPNSTFAERERAEEAVGLALKQLPVGTSRSVMEKVREEALKPFDQVIARRQEEERRKKAQDLAAVRGFFQRIADQR
ncbi:MAG: hypothetical protein JXA57_03055, partial [Armatimonadetes bacterium]|nr:hypothetical protein [Armatimonadota bacterium]